MMSDYRPDPGGNFTSDAHRVVLGHLPLPTDEYGYTAEALHYRIDPTVFGGHEEVDAILAELVADDHVESINGVYRMTQAGYTELTGANANEPHPDDEVVGPAMIASGRPTPYKTQPTPQGPAAATPIGS